MVECFVVAGETAVGKSSFAIRLAKKLLESGVGTRIINGDSQQVIRELPILSDQPLDLHGIPHELYGYRSINDENSSYQWMRDVMRVIAKCLQDGEIPIIVGGSGFYLRNLISGHTELPQNAPMEHSIEAMHAELLARDPECKIHKNDKYRIARHYSLLDKEVDPKDMLRANYDFYSILLQTDDVEQKIPARIEAMFDLAAKEVSGQPYNPRFHRILGYTEVRSYLEGDMTVSDAKERMRVRIRQYAKRQRTWFRRMEFQFVGTSEEFFKKELTGVSKRRPPNGG